MTARGVLLVALIAALVYGLSADSPYVSVPVLLVLMVWLIRAIGREGARS